MRNYSGIRSVEKESNSRETIRDCCLSIKMKLNGIDMSAFARSYGVTIFAIGKNWRRGWSPASRKGNYGDWRILFLINEKPEPVFKYFSRERDCLSFSTEI